MPILRGEVYFVELGPTRGRELDLKRRPVVVVSINDFNRHPLVVTVVPGTSYSGKRVFQNEIKVEPSDRNGLTNATVFQCLQIKALDHGRFDRGPVGVLDSEEMTRIERALGLCLGLSQSLSIPD
jgi:mRNA interferase MazF